jgi:hypothetical protein
MATPKISAMEVSFQSSATGLLTPSTLVSGMLKTENPYTWPIQRWMASAAGGTSQRLYPGPATVCSRSKILMASAPVRV